MIRRRNYVILCASGAFMAAGLGLGTVPQDLAVIWERMRMAREGLPREGASASGANGLVSAMGRPAAEPLPLGETTRVERQGGPQFEITDLGPLEGNVRFLPVAFNEQGDVLGSEVVLTERKVRRKRDGKLQTAGFLVLKRRGILIRDGRRIDLGSIPGYPFTVPVGLSNQGEVVGFSYRFDPVNSGFGRDEARGVRVFSWGNPAPKLRDLNLAERAQAQGFDIQEALGRASPSSMLFNDRGHIVLQLPVMGSTGIQTYLYDGKKFSTIYAANARWLNNEGVILGFEREMGFNITGNGTGGSTGGGMGGAMGTLYLFDVMSRTGRALPMALENLQGFNDRSEILCSETRRDPSGMRTAYRLWVKDSMIPLATVEGMVGRVVLNNRREVAGMVDGGWSDKPGSGPYLWRGGKLYDLNDSINGQSGWLALSVLAMNDRSEILTVARQNGKTRVALLRPRKVEETTTARIRHRMASHASLKAAQ